MLKQNKNTKKKTQNTKVDHWLEQDTNSHASTIPVHVGHTLFLSELFSISS